MMDYILGFLVATLITTCTGQLLVEDKELSKLRGEESIVECSARLNQSDTLAFLRNNALMYVINAASLDALTKTQIFQQAEFSVTEELRNAQPPYVTVNLTLRIPRTDRSDEGSYVCQYKDQIQTTTIQVIGPPFKIDFTSSSPGISFEPIIQFNEEEYPGAHAVHKVYINIDEDNTDGAVLVASPGANPVADVTWTHEKYELGGPTITLEREKSSNGSRIRCTARNQYGDFNAILLVVVQYAPRYVNTIGGSDFYPLEGAFLSVVCEFDAAPAASVFYTKTGAGDSWTRINSTAGNALVLRSVNLENDIGTYTCVGGNTFGSDEATFTIHGKPKETVLRVLRVYGDSADLLLTAHSSLPVEFKLFVNNTEMDGSEKSMQVLIDDRLEVNLPDMTRPYDLNDLTPDTDYTVVVQASTRYGAAITSVQQFTTKSADVKRPVVRKRPVDAKDPTNNGNHASIPSFSTLMFFLCLLIARSANL